MELSKESLRKEFSEHYEKYFKVETFEREGFIRKRCRICGRYFWTLDPNRDTCDDPSHTLYSFFREKPNQVSYVEFWDKFKRFWEENGHAIINRYPVVSRWRQDLYFTIAGIQDFQRLENGTLSFEYPANPLMVPQMCLRFTDIENVGVTGRHFTSFMMANQTAFNPPKEGYWKDRTIELNFDLMVNVLKVKKENLVYHEDVWSMPDFSGFGPCLETFSNGLEIVNSVFTQFGFKNGEVKELDNKVVDVGWGFERALWFSVGSLTAYDAAFGKILYRLAAENSIPLGGEAFRKLAPYSGSLDATEPESRKGMQELFSKLGISKEVYEKEIRPAQELYAILDHTRTLLFAITDGALPSNIGGGYNLRVILRRALEFKQELGLKESLTDIARMIAEELKPLYPELTENLDTFDKVIEIERQRYEKTKQNAAKTIEALLAKKNELSEKEVKTLYESNGITPEMIEKVAREKGKEIRLPENPYLGLIEKDMVEERKKKTIPIDVEGISPTKQLYYDFATYAKAKVVYVKDNYVVLDQTPFYPEGGGQVADTGYIDAHKVVDVQKIKEVIVHVLEKGVDLKPGQVVEAKVDEDRRNRLIAHHTATHLISAAARKILGKHAWQEGAKKEPEKAHIDVAHYDKLSDEELKQIENTVNAWLLSGIKVNSQIMKRGEAESRYGFTIYQGHGVPSKEMRIITITDLNGNLIDAEACGGLHAVGREHLIGFVKIIKSDRIHDGVDRIEFVAGKSAVEFVQKEHELLKKSAEALSVEPEALTNKIKEISESALAKEKELERSYEEAGKLIAQAYAGKSEIMLKVDAGINLLEKMANTIASLNKQAVVLLENKNGNVVCIAGEESKENAMEFIKKHFKSFKGGGNAKFAEGKVEG